MVGRGIRKFSFALALLMSLVLDEMEMRCSVSGIGHFSASGFSNCILPPLCGSVIDLVSQRRGKLISEGP